MGSQSLSVTPRHSQVRCHRRRQLYRYARAYLFHTPTKFTMASMTNIQPPEGLADKWKLLGKKKGNSELDENGLVWATIIFEKIPNKRNAFKCAWQGEGTPSTCSSFKQFKEAAFGEDGVNHGKNWMGYFMYYLNYKKPGNDAEMGKAILGYFVDDETENSLRSKKMLLAGTASAIAAHCGNVQTIQINNWADMNIEHIMNQATLGKGEIIERDLEED